MFAFYAKDPQFDSAIDINPALGSHPDPPAVVTLGNKGKYCIRFNFQFFNIILCQHTRIHTHNVELVPHQYKDKAHVP